jgi:hypothetical protein
MFPPAHESPCGIVRCKNQWKLLPEGKKSCRFGLFACQGGALKRNCHPFVLFRFCTPKRWPYDRGIRLPIDTHFATLYLDKNLNLYF